MCIEREDSLYSAWNLLIDVSGVVGKMGSGHTLPCKAS